MTKTCLEQLRRSRKLTNFRLAFEASSDVNKYITSASKASKFDVLNKFAIILPFLMTPLFDSNV